MTKGQVKWFDPKKGYGFIIGPDGQDVFIHYSQIHADGFKTLKDDEWVEYDLVESEKGWQARNVKPAVETESPSGSPGVGGASDGDSTPKSGGYEAGD